MWRDRKHVVLALAILSVALGIRLAAAAWWQARLPAGTRFAFGDSESYWVLAQSIVRGEPYEYGEGMRIFRVPGYPLLLATLFAVAGEEPPVLWARAMGAVLGTLAVGAVMALSRLVHDARGALWAGLLAALYPGAISMSVFVLSEALFCPLLVLQLLCWTIAVRGDSSGSSLLWGSMAGILSGCATLARPSWLLFAPGAVVLAMAFGGDRRRHLVVGASLLALMALTMLPWWVRSYRITDRFVLTTLQMGASLYDGLRPGATGASDMEFVSEFLQRQALADRQQAGPLESTFEYRLDRRLRRAALEWAQRHPRRVVELAAIKLWRMWSPWPHAAEMQGWVFRWGMALSYTPLAALAVWGLVRFRRGGWPVALCALPAVYFTALHMVFVSSVRYREPAMLVLIVLAGGVWSQLVSRVCGGEGGTHLRDRNAHE